MPVVTRQFFAHEKGNHDETFYSLARDTETGEVFIEHGWAARANVGTARVELVDFLHQPSSSAKDKLLALIGSLVPDEPVKQRSPTGSDGFQTRVNAGPRSGRD